MKAISKVICSIILSAMLITPTYSSAAELESKQNNIPISESINEDQDISPKALYRTVFQKTSSSTVYGSYSRASSVTKNSTLNNMTKAFNITKGYNYTISATLSSAEKDAISASLGSSWTRSKSISETDTITIRPKYYGWFDARCAYRQVKGTLITYHEGWSSKKSVTIKTPIGIEYRAKTSLTSPY